MALAIALLTISDSRTFSNDVSGDRLQERLLNAGHQLHQRKICPDDRYRIRADLCHWIAEPTVDVVITCGGTGVTGRDGTPEAVEPLFDKKIEGFGEVFRMISYEEIGTSTMQSRCIAGVSNGTYIFCLPGSSGACATGWDRLIGPQLDSTNQPCNLVDLMPRLTEV